MVNTHGNQAPQWATPLGGRSPSSMGGLSEHTGTWISHASLPLSSVSGGSPVQSSTELGAGGSLVFCPQSARGWLAFTTAGLSHRAPPPSALVFPTSLVFITRGIFFLFLCVGLKSNDKPIACADVLSARCPVLGSYNKAWHVTR